jgi:PAS domain S-box-containing protein
MDDMRKTKQQLVNELSMLRTRVEALEYPKVNASETTVRLATFPEDNPHPVTEVELSGCVKYLNPAARHLFPDLIVGGQKEAAVHPWLADWGSVARRFQEMGTGTLLREVMIGESCYQQAMYKSGSSVRIYGVDITEYKEAQDALRISESRYRELVQNANSAIVRWACDGTVTFINEYAETLFGYSSSEIVGKNVSLLVPEIESTGEDLTKLVKNIVARPEQFVNVVNENIRKDGHRLWMAWTNKPIRDQHGQVSEILAVGIDITELRQTEEALRESEDKFKYIFDHSVVGKSITLPTGEVQANQAFSEMLGYSVEELRTLRWQDITHPDDIELTQQAFTTLLSGESEAVRVVKRYLSKDGSIIWGDVSSSLRRDKDGNPLYFMTVILNITERRQTEEALHKSEELLNRAQEIAHLGSWELDLVSDRLIWSDEVYRIFGFSPQEFGTTYEAFLEAVHPDDRVAVDNAYSSSLHEDRDSYDIEHRIVKKTSGEIRYVHEKCEHLRDESGKVIRSIGMVHDITGRKQAEAALRESEERFRRAIKEAPFPIMMHAEDGTVIAVSDTWLDLTGYTRQDVSTVARWTKKAFGERWLLVKTEFDRLYGLKGKVKQGEYTIVTRHGETRMWDFISTPLGSLPNGRKLVLSMAVDVTKHRQMEEALLVQNEYLAALQETMLDLATQLDLNSLLENIVKRAGQLLRTPSGYLGLADPATGQIRHQVGLGILSEMLECLAETGEDIVEMIWRTGEPAVMIDYNVQQYDANDLPMACSAIGVPMLSGSRMLGVLALACDAEVNQQFDQADVDLLTQLARLASIAIENAQLVEALRQTNAELKASNEELDAFGHTVAHDLKNPLGSIIGFANLLADEENPLPMETIHELARSFEELSLRMDNIIEELMLLAGLRKAVVRMSPLDMNHIVAEAQRRLTYMIRNAQAEIVVPSNWPQAVGYASWVEEIWINYISNAIKYGGKPPRIELGAAQQEGKVRFWVRDNGTGLTDDQMSRLFQPFERLDQANLKGHGLGLSIVQRIAERMDGQVRVESSGVSGEGSTFYFLLPTIDHQ